MGRKSKYDRRSLTGALDAARKAVERRGQVAYVCATALGFAVTLTRPIYGQECYIVHLDGSYDYNKNSGEPA